MSNKIKLGFVGVGFMGQVAHLKNYSELDDCEVVAIAEPRKKLAESVAAKYNVKNICSNHHELISNYKLDAIVASQPFNYHAILIPDILKAKIPVFTEKPITVSIEAGEKLAKLAKENNTIYMVGYHKRSDPAMEYAKNLIDTWKKSGEFGKMSYVRITMPEGDWGNGIAGFIESDEAYPANEKETPINYFNDKFNRDYVAFVNYYIHQINAMRFLLGEDYKLTFADKSGVMLATESDSGVCGVIEMSPYHNTTDWQETLLVCFDYAYIKVELPPPLAMQRAGVVTVMRDNKKEQAYITQPILPNIHAMKNQAKNFIAAVKKEKPVTCNPEDAVKDLIIAKEYIKLKNNL